MAMDIAAAQEGAAKKKGKGKLIAIEGVLGIREGMASRILVERLEARLSPEMRKGHTGRAGKSPAAPQVAA